jgi:integrase
VLRASCRRGAIGAAANWTTLPCSGGCTIRGKHPEFVFTYRGHPVQRINNNGWRCARRSVGLTPVRVHDLKHTYSRRLRAVGVPLETRKVLRGHKNGDITTHYSAPELQELIDAAERVCDNDLGKTSAVTLLKKKAVNGWSR